MPWHATSSPNAGTGSLGYSCYEDIAERNVFIFYEEWRAKEDIDAHLAQPYTQALLAAARAMGHGPAGDDAP